jgi:hypothetical protein
MRSWRLGLLVLVIGLLGLAGSASAAPTWSLSPAPPAQAPNGQYDAVSCGSPTRCEAIGMYYAPNGTTTLIAAGTTGSSTWSAQTLPAIAGTSPVPDGLSCFSTGPSSIGCVAIVRPATGTEVALVFNGTSWSKMTSSPPVSGGAVLSCTAASACMVVSAWTAAGAVSSPAGFVSVQAVTCTGPSACVAVGYAEANGRPYASKWNGSTAWATTQLPVPAGSQGAFFGSVGCSTSTTCTAVGSYQDHRGRTLTLADGLSGSTWKLQTTPNPAGGGYGSLDEVSCAPAGPCTAVGSGGGFVERLVGTTWTLSGAPPAPPGYDALINGLSCASATVCMFAGYDDQGTQRTLAESWNGSSWTPQTTPNPAGATDSQFDAVSCAGSPANGCLAVGNYLAANDYALPFAETWNGSAWAVHSPTIAGPSDMQLTGVSCHASNSCEAVGFGFDSGGNPKPVAAAWNGTSWTSQSPSIPAAGTGAILSGVSCTAASACTAVGSYQAAGGQVLAFAERFTGTWGAALITPNPSNAYGYMALYGVSCTGATCETVGEADPASGGEQPLAELLSGSTWKYQPLPNSYYTDVFGNALYGVSCTASNACTAAGVTGGSFTSAYRFTGSWAVQGTPSPSPDFAIDGFSAVSCAAATACTAVGTFGAEGWTKAGGWVNQAFAPPPNPQFVGIAGVGGVACTAAAACTAAGFYELDPFFFSAAVKRRAAAIRSLRAAHVSRRLRSTLARRALHGAAIQACCVGIAPIDLPLAERYS